MFTSIAHKEFTYKGRVCILDSAEMPDGSYETMLMRKSDGEEIACLIADTEAEALKQFETLRSLYKADMPKRYPEPKKPAAVKPLTGKYAKLRDDLSDALAAGRAAQAKNPEDGGACNFDSPALRLPRWNSALVEQAAREAGTTCFSWDSYGGKRWVFTPLSGAQANARSRNAEAMCAAFKAQGYDAFMYYQMD